MEAESLTSLKKLPLTSNQTSLISVPQATVFSQPHSSRVFFSLFEALVNYREQGQNPLSKQV
jgi:hypothetical protein